ncbi:MinD/ParA family protein [Actinomadura vinacea]|uniref:MinD/ParA family ATP-binding protein n=1 Tax=Actinomadura vinacea TaxID=115336 RepID=UPI0031E46A08
MAAPPGPPPPPAPPPFLQPDVASQQSAGEQPAQEQPPEYPSMVRPETGAFGASLAFGLLAGVDPDEPFVAEAAPPGPAQQAPAQEAAAAAGHQGPRPPAEDLVSKDQHGDRLVRRVGRGMRKAVGGNSSRDAQWQAAFAELMQHPVPSCRQLAVASVRGGAGKTTMAALLATELARHRGDRVLAADADAELGSLPLRLGVHAERSLFDLAETNPRSFEEAAQFLSRTGDGLWVMSSTRGGRIAGEFTLDTFQTALGAVNRYLSAAVVDCGAGILTELNRGILAASHGLVLVTPGTVDGALSARGALEWFATNNEQGLLSRTAIAMVSHAPQANTNLERAQQMLTAWGLPVVHVPYDRHVATGSALDMTKISAATQKAVNRIVHEVFARSLSAPGASR